MIERAFDSLGLGLSIAHSIIKTSILIKNFRQLFSALVRHSEPIKLLIFWIFIKIAEIHEKMKILRPKFNSAQNVNAIILIHG